MSSIDFDAVLDHLGAEGRYQTVLYYLLCIPATIPAAFLAFNQVFLSATPAHWCRVPQLESLNWTVEERKAFSIPQVEGKYAECSMYDVNFTDLILERSSGSSPDAWTPDATWTTTSCQLGWEYDRTNYESTLVTEVSALCVVRDGPIGRWQGVAGLSEKSQAVAG